MKVRLGTIIVIALLALDAAADIFRPGEFFVGVNYWGSQAGIHMWRAQDWDEKEIEKDIAALVRAAKEARAAFDEGRFHKFRALFHLGAARKVMNPELY